MEHLNVRAYFDLTKKGRGKRAQALLQLMRKQAAAAQHDSFTLDTDAESGQSLNFRTTDTSGLVVYNLTRQDNDKLPTHLKVLKPSRVVLMGHHHFNFPDEGIYEGGGEVVWSSTWHNTDYGSKAPAAAENTWKVVIEAVGVEEAYAQLRRIRTGEAPLKYRWVNRLPLTQPHETGAGEVSHHEAELDFIPQDSAL